MIPQNDCAIQFSVCHIPCHLQQQKTDATFWMPETHQMMSVMTSLPTVEIGVRIMN